MLLRLVYGQRWSETDAPRALAVYCLYILLLALNGILEAFEHAVADSKCACSCSLGLPVPVTRPRLTCDTPGAKRCENPQIHRIMQQPGLDLFSMLWHLPPKFPLPCQKRNGVFSTASLPAGILLTGMDGWWHARWCTWGWRWSW